MMKHLSLSLLLLMTTAPLSVARAQSPGESISSLLVSLWPDFDRRSVLVILTGTLPADRALPADVTLPFPESGQLNAVARISSDDRMIDDIAYSRRPGEITLTTPDPRFRVEYYYPYRVDGQVHAFTFSWLAATPVDRISVAVQQPIGADTLTTLPPASAVVPGEHGMQNHLLPSRAVSAGQEVAIEVRYAMPVPVLSVKALAARSEPATADAPGPSAPAAAPAASFVSSWWFVISVSAVAFVAIGLFWRVGSVRAGAGEAASGGRSPDPQTEARFCQNCGRAAQMQDRFCRSCGTKLG